MDDSREFFSKHQYLLLEHFLPAAECREMLHAVEQCRKRSGLITVKQSSVTSRKNFLTFNGEDLEENIPAAVPLYAKVNEVVNRISGNEYAPLENRKIGLSINVTPAGGTFSWHHDRHEITAILYLNEVDGGGELEFFPNSRLLLKNNRQWLRKWLQLGCDAVGLAFSMAIRKKVTVVPKPGLMCVMVGTRCTHRVRPVVGDRDRVCVIFAYDVPGKNFSRELTADYYGYK
ncbi:MAG: 2OG-Fe(II) oxygenase [Bryobacterales bacterium]|nr:2OG-Fe(II) oxygenase [Bryobacterales bacterium]